MTSQSMQNGAGTLPVYKSTLQGFDVHTPTQFLCYCTQLFKSRLVVGCIGTLLIASSFQIIVQSV